jgi:hypothetical protein
MSRVAPSTRNASRIAWLRFAVGVAMTFGPRPILRIPAGDEPSATAVLLLRTIGVRDIVLGLGAATAARTASPDAMRPWIRAGLLSDSLDVVVATVTARPETRRDSLIAAITPIPFLALDLAALATLR